MTPNQKKFVELEKQKEMVKKYFEELSQALELVAQEIGINGYFQDDDRIVYQIVSPEGKYVVFDKISYTRTRRENEDRGTLSLKKAQDAGFKVKE